MNTNTIYSKFRLLPENLKQEVNHYIEFLLQKNNIQKNETKNNLIQFSGIFSEKEANEFSKIIEEGCNKIDSEW